MITLALDTATPYLALALRTGTTTIAHSPHLERAHAEQLPAQVAALFAEAKHSEAGLDFCAHKIVLGIGPGSYTGVRVGASYALALARVWQAELVGVSTLCSLLDISMAAPQLQAVALDARKGNVYGAIYQVDAANTATNTDTCITEISPPQRLSAEDFAALAQAHGAQLNATAQAIPSGLSLIAAAANLGQPEPQLRLCYL